MAGSDNRHYDGAIGASVPIKPAAGGGKKPATGTCPTCGGPMSMASSTGGMAPENLKEHPKATRMFKQTGKG
jgi:hypothetical protein